MASFETETTPELYGIAGRALGDDVQKSVATIRVRDSQRGRGGGLSWRLAENLAFEVQLFNDEKDRDRAHGVIGKLSKNDRSKRIGWFPLIELGENGAWLKYTTSVRLHQTASVNSGPRPGFSLTGRAWHFYYHRHRRNTRLLTALSADLADQKTAFSRDDVLGLTPSQAVGFETAGAARFSFKLSWGELLASGMNRLAGLLDSSEAVRINTSASALAEFEVTVEDGFRLVFLGLPGNRVRVALRKSGSVAGGLGVEAGIRVKFARPSEISRLLDQVIEGLLGISPGDFNSAVDRLTETASLDRLSAPQRGVLESLAESLGLQDDFETASEALNALDGFRDRVGSTLTDIARVKVGAGFAYEYSRLATDASVYEGDFTRAALGRLHRELLGGRFQSILAASERSPGEIRTRRFLNQKSLVIRNSIGLSLGAGNASLSGRERSEYRFIRQENADRAIRLSLRGIRRYEGEFFGPLESVRAEFRAGMPGFEPDGEAIGVDAFRFAFAVTYEDGRAWSSAARLRSFLDMGLLCGIAPEGDLDVLAAQVNERFARKKTRCILTLRLSHTAVIGFSEWLTRSPDRELAAVIAGAMEYSEQRPALQMIHNRRYLYSKFWREALRRQWDDPYRASRFALGVLRPLDTSLYRAERQALRRRGRDPVTVFMLMRRNPDLLRDLRTLRLAFARLDEAWRDNSPHGVLPGIVREMHGFANTRFKTRVTGALVNGYRSSGQAPSRGINMAAMISAVNGDEVMTIGRKH